MRIINDQDHVHPGPLAALPDDQVNPVYPVIQALDENIPAAQLFSGDPMPPNLMALERLQYHCGAPSENNNTPQPY